MSSDPWSRPTVKDLQYILESIENNHAVNNRNSERLELQVPAEIVTRRGNTIAAVTREISRSGIGLFHKGSITPGMVTVKMASETRNFEYHVNIEWCTPCEKGMFISGGSFINKEDDAE